MKPKPYIPRPWQLPHLLAMPAGGRVLIVERCEEQPRECSLLRECPRDLTHFADGTCGSPLDGLRACGKSGKPLACKYPVGTVLACKETWGQDFERVSENNPCGIRFKADWTNEDEADEYRDWKWFSPVTLPHNLCRLFFRTTAIDLRRVDSMTEEEASAWGCLGVKPQEQIRRRRGEWIVTPLNEARNRYLADNPGATWGDWAWFITAERVERCN